MFVHGSGERALILVACGMAALGVGPDMLRSFGRVASWGLHSRIAVPALLLGAGILGLVATQGWAGSAQGRVAPPPLPKIQHQQAFKQPPKPPEPKDAVVKQAAPKAFAPKQQELQKLFSTNFNPKQRRPEEIGQHEAAKQLPKETEGSHHRHEQAKQSAQAAERKQTSNDHKGQSAKQFDPKQRLHEEARLLQKESEPRQHHAKQDAARDHAKDGDERHHRGAEENHGAEPKQHYGHLHAKAEQQKAEKAKAAADAAAKAKADADAAAKAKAAADAAAKAAQSKPYTAPSVIVPTAPEPVTTTTTTVASTSPTPDAKPTSDDLVFRL